MFWPLSISLVLFRRKDFGRFEESLGSFITISYAISTNKVSYLAVGNFFFNYLLELNGAPTKF
jgi:hypothetical protein